MSEKSKETITALPLSTWSDVVWLAKATGQFKGAVPLLIVLGLAAAAAETLGVGLAVLFLFALLGQRDQIVENGGLLADLMLRVEGAFGTNLTLLAVIFFIMILVKASLVFANDIVTTKLLNDIAQKVRDLIHKNIVTVGYTYLQKRDHGALLNTLSHESWAVADAMYSVSRIGVNLCAVLVFAVGMFTLSWVVAVTSIVCALFVFSFLHLMSRPIQRLGQKTLASNQIMVEKMLVSLNGMRTIRAFGSEDTVLKSFYDISSRVKNLAVRTDRLKALLSPIAEIAALGTLIGVATVASYAGVDIPTMIASVLLLLRLLPHLFQIEANRLSLAGIGASLLNVREMLETDDKPWPVDGALQLGEFAGDIRFEDVTFAHDGQRDPSVTNLSFKIPGRQTTLITGPSGSGKTTILNLLLRLYEPDEGAILVGDTDLANYCRKSWLSRLAIAGQDIELIHNTIAENLRLGCPKATVQDLQEVCEMVEIYEDIVALPDGFETRIGAAGLNFSGGQRQRIGLARSLLCAPEILVLDEAMSALEPEREDRIKARIRHRFPRTTIVIVSHREGAASGVDHHVQIDKGRVVSKAHR